MQKQAKDLKNNDKIIIDGQPHIIKKIETSHLGKHGHAKCRIEAIGLKDKKERIIIRLTEDFIETL